MWTAGRPVEHSHTVLYMKSLLCVEQGQGMSSWKLHGLPSKKQNYNFDRSITDFLTELINGFISETEHTIKTMLQHVICILGNCTNCSGNGWKKKLPQQQVHFFLLSKVALLCSCFFHHFHLITNWPWIKNCLDQNHKYNEQSNRKNN